MMHSFLKALAPDQAEALSLLAPPVEDVRKQCEQDPTVGYRLTEGVARVPTELLQATGHKLRVFVERVSENDDARQVC